MTPYDPSARVLCDKCGSANVEETVDLPPPPPPVSMSDYIKTGGAHAVTLEMKYHKHTLACKDCGHSVTFWR